MGIRRISLIVLASLALLTAAGWLGCALQPTNGGNGQDNDNTNGDGGGETGGFQDNGLAAPAALPFTVNNIPPTGELLFPPEDVSVAQGDVAFRWEATDANETNLDSTVLVGRTPDVFNDSFASLGIRTAPEETEHSLSIRLPDAGTFYWGVEVTDGVNTVQLPADGFGFSFEVSETASVVIGADDVLLLCPRETQPARSLTTFSWSLGDTVPTRAQVFVSRAGQDNPFDSPLRVFDVPEPTATSRALTETEALPMGEQLSWGLRIETAEEVQFTFEGQLGNSFLVAENTPPAGKLASPDDADVLADNAEAFVLSWTADAGNCEDELSCTVYFELLGESGEPTALFESDVTLPITADVLEADLVAERAGLGLVAGTWAWGVLADDGTDQTELPDSEDHDSAYRTFIVNTSPRFESDPAAADQTCGTEETQREAVTVSFADDNGAETVALTVTFAATEALVFDDPTEVLEIPAGDADGETVVFVESGSSTDCTEFAYGAGFYGFELNDGVNDTVRSVMEYAGPPVRITDCNANDVADEDDIAEGTSNDCDLNGVPDECEGFPTVIDAGTLSPGEVSGQGTYDSSINGNNLSGTVCPEQTSPAVRWTYQSGPTGVEMFIRSPNALASSFIIAPAVAGDYVFVLTLADTGLSDSVTLTLTGTGPQ